VLRDEWIAHNDTRGQGHFTVEPHRFLAMFDQTIQFPDPDEQPPS
jgi:hypothetical protein